MIPLPSRLSCAVFCLLFVCGCTVGETPPSDTAAKTTTAETEEPRVARITAGIIFRDPETSRSIRETASRRIVAGNGSTLRLLVTKSRYRLDVFRDNELIKTYPVALGGNPVGPKTVMGDVRTPEGEYLLIPHHPSPSFGGCFYICYPNRIDAERGRSEGVIGDSALRTITECLDARHKPPHDTELGGLILLHGTKQRGVRGLTTNNWTLGCIAMENDDLLELLGAWSADDRPLLEILP